MIKFNDKMKDYMVRLNQKNIVLNVDEITS